MPSVLQLGGKLCIPGNGCTMIMWGLLEGRVLHGLRSAREGAGSASGMAGVVSVPDNNGLVWVMASGPPLFSCQ